MEIVAGENEQKHSWAQEITPSLRHNALAVPAQSARGLSSKDSSSLWGALANMWKATFGGSESRDSASGDAETEEGASMEEPVEEVVQEEEAEEEEEADEVAEESDSSTIATKLVGWGNRASSTGMTSVVNDPSLASAPGTFSMSKTMTSSAIMTPGYTKVKTPTTVSVVKTPEGGSVTTTPGKEVVKTAAGTTVNGRPVPAGSNLADTLLPSGGSARPVGAAVQVRPLVPKQAEDAATSSGDLAEVFQAEGSAEGSDSEATEKENAVVDALSEGSIDGAVLEKAVAQAFGSSSAQSDESDAAEIRKEKLKDFEVRLEEDLNEYEEELEMEMGPGNPMVEIMEEEMEEDLEEYEEELEAELEKPPMQGQDLKDFEDELEDEYKEALEEYKDELEEDLEEYEEMLEEEMGADNPIVKEMEEELEEEYKEMEDELEEEYKEDLEEYKEELELGIPMMAPMFGEPMMPPMFGEPMMPPMQNPSMPDYGLPPIPPMFQHMLDSPYPIQYGDPSHPVIEGPMYPMLEDGPMMPGPGYPMMPMMAEPMMPVLPSPMMPFMGFNTLDSDGKRDSSLRQLGSGSINYMAISLGAVASALIVLVLAKFGRAQQGRQGYDAVRA